MCFLPREQIWFTSLSLTWNISTKVLNMPEKTCHFGFSYSESRLLPTSATLKPLTAKANDSQIWTDHAQHSFTVHPWGFTERSVSELSVFSIWAADWAEKVRGVLRAGHRLDFGGQCAQGVQPSSQTLSTRQAEGRAVSVLSGGFLLECRLPSNKILLFSNSNS